MKTAFSTSWKDLDAPMDSRFGRAPKFLIYDLDGESFAVVDNQQNLNAVHGAGIQSAETVARMGVDCLVTGHGGPNAFRVLRAAGIKVYNADAPTVIEALDRFRSGKLVEAKSADVGGHW